MSGRPQWSIAIFTARFLEQAVECRQLVLLGLDLQDHVEVRQPRQQVVRTQVILDAIERRVEGDADDALRLQVGKVLACRCPAAPPKCPCSGRCCGQSRRTPDGCRCCSPSSARPPAHSARHSSPSHAGTACAVAISWPDGPIGRVGPVGKAAGSNTWLWQSIFGSSNIDIDGSCTTGSLGQRQHHMLDERRPLRQPIVPGAQVGQLRMLDGQRVPAIGRDADRDVGNREMIAASTKGCSARCASSVRIAACDRLGRLAERIRITLVGRRADETQEQRAQSPA